MNSVFAFLFIVLDTVSRVEIQIIGAATLLFVLFLGVVVSAVD